MFIWLSNLTGHPVILFPKTRNPIRELRGRLKKQPRGAGWGGRFEREGMYVYLWLIHVGVWQKPTKYCKAIILPLTKKETSIHL